jgi:hypothetical protein
MATTGASRPYTAVSAFVDATALTSVAGIEVRQVSRKGILI